MSELNVLELKASREIVDFVSVNRISRFFGINK